MPNWSTNKQPLMHRLSMQFLGDIVVINDKGLCQLVEDFIRTPSLCCCKRNLSALVGCQLTSRLVAKVVMCL